MAELTQTQKAVFAMIVLWGTVAINDSDSVTSYIGLK